MSLNNMLTINQKMARFVEANQLRPADVIVVEKKGFRILDHYVVYLGKDHYGEHLFTANMLNTGVRLLKRSELGQMGIKYVPTRIRRFQGSERQREAAVNRALNDFGKGYGLIVHNCEHYANRVQTNRSFSKQSQNAGLALGAIALFGLLLGLSNDNENSNT